jgi:hypothetical protein
MTSQAILWSVRVSSRSVSKGFVQSTRASGVLVLQTGTPPEIRLPARISNSVASPHFGNGIAADSSPLRQRKLAAGKLERGGPLFALAIPAALFSTRRDRRSRSLNLRGVIKALRSLLRFSLVPVSPKTTSGIFQRLFFAPVLSSVPVLHAENKAWSRTHEAQRNRASGAKRYE